MYYIITTIDQIWLLLFTNKNENVIQFLTNANNSEILENNERLDIIRIT